MLASTYYNPYTGKTFFEFLLLLCTRLVKYISGGFPLAELATDEIQILVLAGVAASSALVGTYLILKKMTMLANSLSHTILLGIVVTFILLHDGLMGHEGGSGVINIQAMLIASLATALGTVFLTQLLTQKIRLQEDASTGLVFTTLFALGVILVTLLTRNAHIGAEVVMGNVDALHFDDLKLVYTILALNITLTFLFFKEYKITAFDPGLAISLGFSTLVFDYLLMTQVAATAIGAFRAVGVLMVLAFITGPALTARLITHDLKKIIVLAIALGCLASILGVAFSRHLLSVHGLALSTAGIVVCAIGAIFVAVLMLGIRVGKRRMSHKQ